MLDEIGADEVPLELVLNKIDQVDPLGRRRLANRFPGALQISAVTGEGLDELRERIADRFADRYEDVRLLLPYEEGAKLAELYALGAPIDEREDTEEGVCFRARLPQREVRRFARYLVADAHEGSAAERDVIELPVARLRDDAMLPCAGVRGRRGTRPRRLRAARARSPESGRRRHGHRRRHSGGLAGFVLPRSGLAAKHGLTIVNSPGLIDCGLPRRADGDPAQHRPPTSRSSSSRGCASRSSSSSSCRSAARSRSRAPRERARHRGGSRVVAAS